MQLRRCLSEWVWLRSNKTLLKQTVGQIWPEGCSLWDLGLGHKWAKHVLLKSITCLPAIYCDSLKDCWIERYWSGFTEELFWLEFLEVLLWRKISGQVLEVSIKMKKSGLKSTKKKVLGRRERQLSALRASSLGPGLTAVGKREGHTASALGSEAWRPAPRISGGGTRRPLREPPLLAAVPSAVGPRVRQEGGRESLRGLNIW